MLKIFNRKIDAFESCRSKLVQDGVVETRIKALDAYFKHPSERFGGFELFYMKSLERIRGDAPVLCSLLDEAPLMLGRMLPFLHLVFRTIGDDIVQASAAQKDMSTKARYAYAVLLRFGQPVISEPDAIVLIDRFAQSLAISPEVAICVRGIERGCSGKPSQRLQRRLQVLDSHLPDTPTALLQNEKGLRILDRLIGDGDGKNPKLLAVDALNAQYSEALKRLLSNTLPEMADFIRAYSEKSNDPKFGSIRLKETLIAARGAQADRLFAEILRIVCEIMDDPDWEMDYRIVQDRRQVHPGLLIHQLDLDISEMPRRKLDMDEKTAERALRLCGVHNKLTHNAYFQLRPTIPLMKKIAAALPENSTAISGFLNDSKVEARFLDALLANKSKAQSEDKTGVLDQWLASKRSALATRINTDIYYDYLFDDLAKKHENSPKMLDWTRPNGQLARFAKQIDEYALAILACLRAGGDTSGDVEHLRVLTSSVRGNLKRLRAGDGTLFPVSLEDVPQASHSNFQFCLRHGRSFAKTRSEYVEREQYLLGQLDWMLQQIDFYSGLTPALRGELVEIEAAVGITKSKTRPTERQLEKIHAKLADSVNACIMERLSAFQPAVMKNLNKIGQCQQFALEVHYLTTGLVWASSGLPAKNVVPVLKRLEARSLVHASGVGILSQRLATAAKLVLAKI